MTGLPDDLVQWASSPRPVSVAIDPVALVVTECITVTSAMRKHARWAHSSVSAILGGAVSSPRLELAQSPGSGQEKRESDTDTSTRSVDDDVSLASRWGLRGKRGQSMQDNPLLSAFAKLRSDLKRCKDIHTISAPAIIHPFLQVIRSSSTSAPITSLALIAINKFFAYDIIGPRSPELPLAMQLLSFAVTHCRFEATHDATDEVVLFRILKLMEGMIIGPGGDVLGDESMCKMMDTGISMCTQTRLSELLRRAAEVSMVTMCQTIFQRLKQLEITPEEPVTQRRGSEAAKDNVKMDPSIDGNLLDNQTGRGSLRPSYSFDQSRPQTADGSETTFDESRNVVTTETATAMPNGDKEVDATAPPNDKATAEIRPYGVASIRELFRVLVALLDPNDRQHNDNMRVMALRMVDVAFEVAGPSIASHPSLASLAKDTLCRHLFQLVRSENMAILNESLRVAGTLLTTCRRVLKLQQELFLSYLVACLHPRVEIPHEPGLDPTLYDGVPQAPRLVKQAPTQASSGRSTPVPVKDRQKLGLEGGTRKPDAREAMVESVGGLVRLPSFMTELFVNYDCDIDRSDLCLDMVGLLCRNAFPDAATWSTTNVPPLCLDALLGYIQSIADRLKDDTVTDGLPQIDQLRQQRKIKSIIIQGTTKFNEKPQAGIAFLASQGIIEDASNPKFVVRFLRGTSRLDKRVLGEYISKRSNEALLSAFMDSFDFAELRVDEALRQVLNSFRLPGESALIERIVTEFADKYHSTEGSDDEIATKDALYVLTYAIIMLNTDQHNPNVKSQNRMTSESFAKNLRGVNDGKDFDPAYLEEIYDSIRTREIILPEEHDNKLSYDHAWKELLIKVQSVGDLLICETNLYDAEMFRATWKPVIATLSYVFMSATDDTVFSRVVAGFDQCAQIAAKYEIYEALDHIIYSLSTISTLAVHPLPSTILNTEVQHGERSVMVSETAVHFGRNFKAQLATVVLFRVVKGNEVAIRDGWKHIIRIILNLFVNSLLSTQHFSISSNTDMPSIPLQDPAQITERSERPQESGLFSTFTSYVSSFATGDPAEPNDEEIEATLCTIDCVNACSFGGIFDNVSQLPIESLDVFLDTLLSHIPEEADPRVIVVKPETPVPQATRTNGQRTKTDRVPYDSSVVFVLELATILAARDAEVMAKLGTDVVDALQGILRDANQAHPVTLSRTIFYLFSFLRASHDKNFIRVPLLLHTISKLDEETLKFSANSIVKGLNLCLNGDPGLRHELVNSPDFWLLLHTLHKIPEMANDVFELLEGVAGNGARAVTTDNYEPVVSLLNDFASAGQVGAAEEQRRELAARRGKPLTKKPAPSPPVVRGLRAIQIVFEMSSRAPQFVEQSQLEAHEAWTAYWMPLFRTLTTHSINPCRQIRAQSLGSLQRILLSPNLGLDTLSADASPAAAFTRTTTLFTDVMFRLIMELLKPEIFQSDPGGMSDTRMQAAVLACKVFVRYLDILLDPSLPSQTSASAGLMSPTTERVMPQMPGPADIQSNREDGNAQTQQQPQQAQTTPPWDGIRLWSRILQMMERLIKSSSAAQGGQGDGFGTDEAVSESLKNIVLVMSSAGYLLPPPPPVPAPVDENQPPQQGADQTEEAAASTALTATPGPIADTRTHQQVRLWHVTQVRLDRFLPELLDGVFPGYAKKSPASASAPARATPPRTSTAGEQALPVRQSSESASGVGSVSQKAETQGRAAGSSAATAKEGQGSARPSVDGRESGVKQ